VRIFEPAKRGQLGTVAEQDEYYKRWLTQAGGRFPRPPAVGGRDNAITVTAGGCR
jgi:hypothetical protein